MRLAIIHPFQFRFARGIERFTWSLSSELVASAVEVDLLTWQWPDAVNWGTVPPGMRIRQVPYFRYFQDRWAIPYYVLWLARERYDWVMVFFAGYGEAEALRLCQWLHPQRYCIVFHFPYQQVPYRYAEFKRFGLGRNADRLVAVSEYTADGVQAQFGRPCSVIGNGVDPALFRPSSDARRSVRKQLGTETDAPVLISLSALEERKGIQWAIRAIPHLLPEFPNLQYWVLGEGAYRTALDAEIRRLGLAEHVLLLGSSNDVVSYLAAGDVSCLLSRGESFGLAVIESMATELPIVTSCQPPFDALIRPEWGAQVDERDSAAVAQLLGSLLRDPARRRAMGRAGRRSVLERHTSAQVAAEYRRVLDVPAPSATPR